jgi:hypothetical protein
MSRPNTIGRWLSWATPWRRSVNYLTPAGNIQRKELAVARSFSPEVQAIIVAALHSPGRRGSFWSEVVQKVRNMREPVKYDRGDRIRHREYGLGTILSRSGIRADQRHLLIDFDDPHQDIEENCTKVGS